MNFMANKQGIYEEETASCNNNGKGKFPSSSSNSPSSSPYLPPANNYNHRAWLDERSFGGGDNCSVGGDADDVYVHLPVVEKEHMFDKVVTPSDVGKLNRLVIPKQHAERYFPLDSTSNEKGLLLNFEDRNGKPWRFRYSYWNSSQSYVMTKGWSRFVKEKKLDAGDVVSFQRGVGESAKDRLFIDWRRRPDAPEFNHSLAPTLSLPHHFSFHRPISPWNPLFVQPQAHPRDHTQLIHQNATNRYSYRGAGAGSGNPYDYNTGSVIYFRSCGSGAPPQPGGGGGGGVEPVVFDSVPVVQGKAAAKRLRLFGVNMECPITESDECDILSSTSIPINHQVHQQQHLNYSATTTTTTMMPHESSHQYQQHHLSSSSIPYLQLRPYNGTPIQALPSPDYFNKGKSSMSLDLDI